MPEPADECPACGGPLEELGTLGARSHCRCRNCGAMTSSVREPDDQEDE